MSERDEAVSRFEEVTNMNAIDLIYPLLAQAEKPVARRQPSLPAVEIPSYDAASLLAYQQQSSLLKAAHSARLIKASRNGGLAIDVQRFFERKSNPAPLVERYRQR